MLIQMILLAIISKVILIYRTVVKAYQYTSLTSVMLLDCWSIPSVMLLTWLFLKTKYRFKKITGVVVCVAGLVLVVFSDVHSGDRAGGWLFYVLHTDINIFYLYLNNIYTLSSTMKKHVCQCSISLSLETMQLINFHPIFNIISNMHNSIYGSCLMSYSPVIGGSNPRKGDLLVIAGATLYAISNVSEVS